MSGTDDTVGAEKVPAGRGGADSAAADLVGVEGTTAGTPDEGADNDIAGVGPALPDPTTTQDGAREDVHDASRDARVRGVVVQMQGDIAMGHVADADAVSVLSQRLDEAGIVVADDELAALGEDVRNADAPASVDEAEPGAER